MLAPFYYICNGLPHRFVTILHVEKEPCRWIIFYVSSRPDLYRHQLSRVTLLRVCLTLICVNRAGVLWSAVVSRSISLIHTFRNNDPRTISSPLYLQSVFDTLSPVYILLWAKLQNAGPLIYISLNHKGPYCVMLRSWKDFDTCKTGGPKWPCIL